MSPAGWKYEEEEFIEFEHLFMSTCLNSTNGGEPNSNIEASNLSLKECLDPNSSSFFLDQYIFSDNDFSNHGFDNLSFEENRISSQIESKKTILDSKTNFDLATNIIEQNLPFQENYKRTENPQKIQTQNFEFDNKIIGKIRKREQMEDGIVENEFFDKYNIFQEQVFQTQPNFQNKKEEICELFKKRKFEFNSSITTDQLLKIEPINKKLIEENNDYTIDSIMIKRKTPKPIIRRKKTLELLRIEISKLLDNKMKSLKLDHSNLLLRIQVFSRLANSYYGEKSCIMENKRFKKRDFFNSSIKPFSKRGKLLVWEKTGIFNFVVSGKFVKKYKFITYLPKKYKTDYENGKITIEYEMEHTDKSSSPYDFLKRLQRKDKEKKLQWIKFDGLKQTSSKLNEIQINEKECLELSSVFQLKPGRFGRNCKGKFYTLRKNVVHKSEKKGKRIIASSHLIFKRFSNKKNSKQENTEKSYQLQSFEQL